MATLAALSMIQASDGVAAAAERTVAQLTVVSSRPDMVSNGSALIAVPAPGAASPTAVRVQVNGIDETSAFKPWKGELIGLVSGLKPGKNRVTATLRGTRASLTLVDHVGDQPIFSGPRQKPFICETASYSLPDGSTLGAPLDSDCSAKTKVIYVYMPKGGTAFRVLPSTSALPADMSTTTTTEGRNVNYILRVETGTINRAIYQSAVLFDPTSDPSPSPAADYKGWNRKIVYFFGGSATAGYHQGDQHNYTPTDILGERDKLSRGFALLSSTLNILGVNSNDVLSAETASRVKEHFIKTFGAPIYTMGWGGSGGAMQQYLIANNYPGILDGINPSYSFPDLHSVVPAAVDCSLLARAFSASAQPWTEPEKTAVAGYSTWTTCSAWMALYSPMWMQPKQVEVRKFGLDLGNCAAVVPRSLTYDPKTNPRGARCDIYAGIQNTIGLDPSTRHAYRAFDNVGVLYGLRAYRSKLISPEQFVELNELVGGYDDEGQPQRSRTAASRIALQRMYETGRINEAAHLGNLPIIDLRPISRPSTDVHDAVHSMVSRARLRRATGSVANQVMLRQDATPGAGGSGASMVQVNEYAFMAMDKWLSTLKADRRSFRNLAAKVIADKPKDLVDACFTGTGQKIDETPRLDNTGHCEQLMPFGSNPRMVAGGPITDDVLKCQLSPLKREDFPRLADGQWNRLKAVFPTGVCDYAKAGVGARPLKGPWLSYPSPGVAKALRPT